MRSTITSRCELPKHNRRGDRPTVSPDPLSNLHRVREKKHRTPEGLLGGERVQYLVVGSYVRGSI
jgi:hypothetical protein